MRTIWNQKNRIILCLLLVTAILAIYGRVIDYGFIDFDDNVYITKNPTLQKGLTVEGITCAFTTCALTEGIALWHPLTWISLLVDFRLYGLHPGGYHATNVLFHVANTLLLFLILNRMTHALGRSAFVAALFALHPLHVESVAWVTERKDVLSAFFGLLAINAYLVYVKRRHPLQYLVLMLMFVCSLMAKPMLVTLPFVLLLLDFWPLGRLTQRVTTDAGSTGPPSVNDEPPKKGGRLPKARPDDRNEYRALMVDGGQFRKCFMEKIPLFAIAVLFSIATFLVHQQQGSVNQVILLSDRLSNAIVSYVSYIAKMFLPIHLAIFYPYQDTVPLIKVIGSALFLVIVTAGVLAYARRRPYLFVGWFGYLGMLVPVAGIIQVGQQAMADRYTYLPLVGLFIMIAWGAHEIIAKQRYAKAALTLASLVVISFLMFLSWMQISYWKNSSSLFRHTLSVTRDNHLAHACLGVALQREGNFKEALFNFQEAVRIKPDPLYLTDLGTLYGMLGKTDEAISCLRQALEQKENLERAQYNLGVMLDSQRRDRESLIHLQRSLQLNPRRDGVRFMIGSILIRQGKQQEAIGYFEDEARLGSKNALLYNDLGTVYYKLGQREKGLACYNRALAIEPDNKLVKDNMKIAFTKYGRPNVLGSCP
jgi:tetratricopeptide (TPR) repeat protein